MFVCLFVTRHVCLQVLDLDFGSVELRQHCLHNGSCDVDSASLRAHVERGSQGDPEEPSVGATSLLSPEPP